MGTRASSSEPAPAYNELFEGQARPANTLSGYTLVAQVEESNHDIEQNPHRHTHTEHNAVPIDTLNLPPPEHIHCEACDRLIERKQKRNNERHCCTVVALTHIIAFLCLMILGIVVVQGKQ